MPGEKTHRAPGLIDGRLEPSGLKEPHPPAGALPSWRCSSASHGWSASFSAALAGSHPTGSMFPILLAAARIGLAGAAATAVVACLVAGPLLPLDVATGARQHLLDWSGRLGFFLGIGLVMGAVIVRLKGSLEREIALAREDGYLALRESEAMLRAVFAASPDMITMVEADGELAPPSAAVREILGYEPAEYAQMDRISLIHPDDRERVNESL